MPNVRINTSLKYQSDSNLDRVVTGCITKSFSQLNPKDGGGQYDSSGGAGGKGNPKGSVCTGYNHYVEVGVFPLFCVVRV
jgi:hypothetical protein